MLNRATIFELVQVRGPFKGQLVLENMNEHETRARERVTALIPSNVSRYNFSLSWAWIKVTIACSAGDLNEEDTFAISGLL